VEEPYKDHEEDRAPGEEACCPKDFKIQRMEPRSCCGYGRGHRDWTTQTGLKRSNRGIRKEVFKRYKGVYESGGCFDKVMKQPVTIKLQDLLACSPTSMPCPGRRPGLGCWGPGVDRARVLSPLSPLTGTGTETGVLTESYLPIH
jgi:hypothetical protein